MPVIAAEAATRQLVLHDVIEVSEAAVHLQLAVSEHVVGSAETGGNLLSPAEADSLETRKRVVGRKFFLVKAYTKVQRKTAANGPGIL